MNAGLRWDWYWGSFCGGFGVRPHQAWWGWIVMIFGCVHLPVLTSFFCSGSFNCEAEKQRATRVTDFCASDSKLQQWLRIFVPLGIVQRNEFQNFSFASKMPNTCKNLG